MSRRAPEIEVKGRGGETPPPPVKHPSIWWVGAGLFLVLALVAGGYNWVRTRQAPPPAVMTQVKPGETIGSQKTGTVAVAKAASTNLPAAVTGLVASVVKPVVIVKPEPPRPGAIRVKVTVPDYAATFLAGAGKRLRFDTNSWQTIQSLPCLSRSVPSGLRRVGLEVDGFSCSTLLRTTEAAVLVEPDRTNEVEFVLTPRPATLTVSCNVTNAMIAINNQQPAIVKTLSVPSLQPLTLAVSAPGHRSQSLRLEALFPGATEHRAVALEREAGKLRVVATTLDHAQEFLAKTCKRISVHNTFDKAPVDDMNEWISMAALPHEQTNVGCGVGNSMRPYLSMRSCLGIVSASTLWQ